MEKQSPEDLKIHFSDQIRFIKKSCSDYDRGDHGEAKRIANALRLLCHSKGRVVSLLDQLKKIDHSLKDLLFLDTAKPHGEMSSSISSPYWGLTNLQLSPDPGKYQPLLDNYEISRMLSFTSWWEGEVLGDQERLFSRKDIILHVTEKDGGTHVDAKLDNFYAKIKVGSFELEGVRFRNGKIIGPVLFSNPFFSTIRQITFEFLFSIETHLLKSV